MMLGKSLQVRAARDNARARSGVGEPAADIVCYAACLETVMRLPRSLPARGSV
jgi:hypothetical protein